MLVLFVKLSRSDSEKDEIEYPQQLEKEKENLTYKQWSNNQNQCTN